MKSKILLTASIVAGLLALVFAQAYIRGQKGSPVQVFRTTGSIKAGEPIGTRYEPVTLPGEKLFPNILKEAPGAGMDDLVRNTPTREPLGEGELILFRHLSNTVDPGVRRAIPKGMKALSISVDESTAVSYMIQPEDLVDVLATVPGRTALDPQGALIGQPSTPGSGLVTKPVLQAVEVLAVGGRYRRAEPSAFRDGYSSVTLLLSLEEAQKITYLRDVLDADLTLVLRGPEDEARDDQVRSFGIERPDFDQVGNVEP